MTCLSPSLICVGCGTPQISLQMYFVDAWSSLFWSKLYFFIVFFQSKNAPGRGRKRAFMACSGKRITSAHLKARQSSTLVGSTILEGAFTTWLLCIQPALQSDLTHIILHFRGGRGGQDIKKGVLATHRLWCVPYQTASWEFSAWTRVILNTSES